MKIRIEFSCFILVASTKSIEAFENNTPHLLGEGQVSNFDLIRVRYA